MKNISFSLAQIEAFACLYESNNLSLAAKKLGKDRTTISELIDNLEINLGYKLFNRQKRPMIPTQEGEHLYREARLFLQEAERFSYTAQHITKELKEQLTICYDIFIPRQFLQQLVQYLKTHNIKTHLICTERFQAEQLLNNQQADLAFYPAMNRSINDQFKWQVLGNIQFAVYARKDFFSEKVVSLSTLTHRNQLLPFINMPEYLGKWLQLSDRTQVMTELECLKQALSEGEGWALLPSHLRLDITTFCSELSDTGFTHTVVALWKPLKTSLLEPIMGTIQQLYKPYYSC